ncbi:MAG: ferritin-like domain-containing protein [Clostridia bacterium]|nr:ferritin-like domain-containing protein [Clostridia bacterium]
MYSDYNNYYSIFRGNRQDMINFEEELITPYQAIELIRKSIGDERNDELFYDRLIEQAPTEKEKSIIQDIRDNEKKHNMILREVYYDFTGQMLQNNINMMQENMQNNLSYTENLEKALFGELEAVNKYRKILSAMPQGKCYTLIMSIMTDELRHSAKYNYLIHMAAMQ